MRRGVWLVWVALAWGCRALPQGPEGPRQARGHPVLLQVLAYVPNRVVDALETVRCGVGVGPGLGAEVRVTEFAQVGAMSGFVAGVGWQGRWHSPLLLDTRSYLAVGPLTLGVTATNPLLSWPREPWAVGGEVHAGLVMAQAQVDLFEIVDFLAGFLFLDPAGDDFFGP